MTMDRMDATARFGLQLGFLKLDGVDLDEGFILRPEIYGQTLLPGSLLGVYGQIPFTWLVDFDGDDRLGNGNLELGGFYLLGGSANIILRGGLSIDMASDDVDAVLNGISTWERLTDTVGIIPNTTALRLSASTVRQLDVLFYRVDFGFDFLLDSPADEYTFLRANIAVGARLPSVDLTAELVNLAGLGGDESLANKFFHTLALGLRTRGQTQFHLGMVFPLDEEIRGDVWIVSMGLHFTQ